MTNVVIASAARTAVGSFGGAFATTPAHDLGAAVLEAVVARAGIDKAEVSETILGQVLTAAQGQNPARQAHVNAGLPIESAAWGINQVCGSGLRAVALGAQHIQLGDAAIVCANSLLARQPEPHMVATSAARAGLLNLVRSMATEFAPQGVRVNGILIGLVESGQWRRRFEAREDKSLDWAAWSGQLAKTKHIPLGRLGLPTEAARAILFLASPLASYTTGSHIDISGGHSRHA